MPSTARVPILVEVVEDLVGVVGPLDPEDAFVEVEGGGEAGGHQAAGLEGLDGEPGPAGPGVPVGRGPGLEQPAEQVAGGHGNNPMRGSLGEARPGHSGRARLTCSAPLIAGGDRRAHKMVEVFPPGGGAGPASRERERPEG